MEQTKPLDSLSKLFADCAELERAAILLADIAGRGPDALDRCERARRYVDEARRVLEPGSVLAFEEPATSPEARPNVLSGWVKSLTKKRERTERAHSAPKLEAPSKEHVLAIQGNSGSIPLFQLLSFLGTLQETGTVKVTAPSEIFSLELKQGVVVHAQSNNAPRNAMLGNILVEMGAVDRAKLEEALGNSHGGRLGETLERGALVNTDDLKRAVERQIQMLFDRLFHAQDAEFAFWKGEPRYSDGRIHLNVMQLLLESARSADERRNEKEKANAAEAFLSESA